MSLKALEIDEHGNVVAKTVTGWSTTTINNVTAIVQIEFGETDAARKADRKIIQLELTPEQCLQLASGLIGVANHMVEEKLKIVRQSR